MPTQSYDNWLAEPYEYPDEGCIDCWIEDHPESTDEEREELNEQLGQCTDHGLRSYEAYMEDNRDD